MKSYVFFLKFFLLINFLPIYSAQTLVYEKSSGKGTFQTTYTIEKSTENYKIIVTGRDQLTTLEASIPYSLQSYIYESKKNSSFYKIILTGSKLKATGNLKGEKMEAEYVIDKKTPWIQEFDFGLLPLLISKKSSLNFQLINPKNFKLHKMVAKKQGIETLHIKDVAYQAELVNVTLQGFKSMFWKAQIWFDAKTHDLLMYKSNEGPHTPTTTITLISKTGTID